MLARATPLTTPRALLSVLAASLAVAAAAQVALPLPFSPVPVTLQTVAVVLVGAALGPRLGALAILTYLAEGSAGLPFFAGGTSGPAVLLGPTGGYLVGFVVSAFLAGLLIERGWWPLLAFGFAGAVVYACGLPWLALFVGAERAPALGLLPFLPGDLVKTVAASLLWAISLSAGRAWHRRR